MVFALFMINFFQILLLLVLATKNAQYHSFICKPMQRENHKITLYDNTFYYEVKMHYADEWLRVAKGTYEVKEFTSNKKKK